MCGAKEKASPAGAPVWDRGWWSAVSKAERALLLQAVWISFARSPAMSRRVIVVRHVGEVLKLAAHRCRLRPLPQCRLLVAETMAQLLRPARRACWRFLLPASARLKAASGLELVAEQAPADGVEFELDQQTL